MKRILISFLLLMNPILPEVTPEQRAENDRRMMQEDSIRNAYVATFPTAEQADSIIACLKGKSVRL